MKLSDFNFYLPNSLIAQKPSIPKDSCRLMVVNKKLQNIIDDRFYHLDQYIKKGDVLVFNNSKVLPARLIGKKETGGKAEALLLKQESPNSWDVLVGNIPISKQKGATISFSRSFSGIITERRKDTALIEFNLGDKKLMKAIMKHGKMPTPPYIKRIARESEYQNIFANPKKLGSVAAPTAGLHFTNRLIKKLKKKEVQIEFITLHVGLGTFAPVKTQEITKHHMHSEYFELDTKTATRLNKAKKEGRRIIAVGTTSVRVLETCAQSSPPYQGGARGGKKLRAQSGDTDIFIYPGYSFKFVDAMITNFHTPYSTLLMLVSAFAGKKLIDKAYKRAVKEKYRFYSLGDAMFIE